jgi:hypothetical protein
VSIVLNISVSDAGRDVMLGRSVISNKDREGRAWRNVLKFWSVTLHRQICILCREIRDLISSVTMTSSAPLIFKTAMASMCCLLSNPLKLREVVNTSSWNFSEIEGEGASLIYGINCVRSMVTSRAVGEKGGILTNSGQSIIINFSRHGNDTLFSIPDQSCNLGKSSISRKLRDGNATPPVP